MSLEFRDPRAKDDDIMDRIHNCLIAYKNETGNHAILIELGRNEVEEYVRWICAQDSMSFVEERLMLSSPYAYTAYGVKIVIMKNESCMRAIRYADCMRHTATCNKCGWRGDRRDILRGTDMRDLSLPQTEARNDMDPTGTRMKDAVEWLRNAPHGERRTQAEAAKLFGITQASISGYIRRYRQECPTCGQKVTEGVVLSAHVKPVSSRDAESLRRVVTTYAWHLGECPAYDDSDAPCDCGFGVYLEKMGG
jgi:hypothetical protein